ncbi:MAG: hypothetical protein R8M11_10060 [Gallionella sp.]
MTRGRHPKRDLLRDQLAHLAAKIMAESGITDHAAAKHKAVRQLGSSDTQHLPGNDEIDLALHSYRLLYQHDFHPAILSSLRTEALEAMLMLSEFKPYLTGSVFSGSAGQHSDVNLILYSDDAKAVLLHRLKHKVDFVDGEWRIRIKGREEIVPSYTLTTQSDIQTHIVVLPENTRNSGRRHPETHADIETVKALLQMGNK